MYFVCKDNCYYAAGCWVSNISLAIPFDFETAVRVACEHCATVSFICGAVDFLFERYF